MSELMEIIMYFIMEIILYSIIALITFTVLLLSAVGTAIALEARIKYVIKKKSTEGGE